MIQSLGNEALSDETQKLDPNISMYRCKRNLELVKGFIHKYKINILNVSEVDLQY